MLRHCNLPLNIFTDFRGHNMAKYTKQQAISIITDCAVKYKNTSKLLLLEVLCTNFLFYSKISEQYI